VSLEHAASGVDDQRQFIELSLTEIRQTLVGLGDGLGQSLQRSLREVDDVLGKTVGQLRDTLVESNETIDRLSSPIRAAEGSTREIHLALDRIRGEVEALGQWMNQAAKPLRAGLTEVEGRVDEISRAMTEFNDHTRQIDKTMQALRQEIHEESRRLQGSGNELGRRLQQTSDAVGLLESATSEATRRSGGDSATSPTRERHWSPSPSDHDSAARPSASEPETGLSQDTFSSGSGATSSVQSQDSNAAAGSGSGYRLGAPRAQGPDPYDRFDNTHVTDVTDESNDADNTSSVRDADDASQPPSNLRHFPTPERGLGGDLKLSGLLGKRSSEAGPEHEAAAEPENQDAKTDPEADRPSTDEPG
jgi:prefoldin subunit 5